MKAEKVLGYIAELRQATARNSFAKIKLDELEQLCREDMMVVGMKTKTEQNRYKAALKFAKYCEKHASQGGFRGAFTTEDGKQAICDGYTCVLYDEHMDALPEVRKDEYYRPFNVDEIFRHERGTSYTLPDLKTLKTVYKIAKSSWIGERKHFYHYTQIGRSYFNTKYLINIMEMTCATEIYLIDRANVNGEIYADGVRGIIAPIRIADNRKDQNIYYTNADIVAA